MASESDLVKLIDDIEAEFPDFLMKKKSASKFMKALDVALKILSLGTMKKFMTHFVTTIGNTIYLPSEWSGWTTANKLAILKHERVHMRQSRDVGRLKFSLLYLFLPFPVVFSHYRKKFEMEAYEESLRTYVKEYGPEILTPEVRENMIRHFTSSEYLWMWPWRKSVEAWYDNFVASLKK